MDNCIFESKEAWEGYYLMACFTFRYYGMLLSHSFLLIIFTSCFLLIGRVSAAPSPNPLPTATTKGTPPLPPEQCTSSPGNAKGSYAAALRGGTKLTVLQYRRSPDPLTGV